MGTEPSGVRIQGTGSTSPHWSRSGPPDKAHTGCPAFGLGPHAEVLSISFYPMGLPFLSGSQCRVMGHIGGLDPNLGPHLLGK